MYYLLPALCGPLMLAACALAPVPDDVTSADGASDTGPSQQLLVERAYTLEDSRDQAFREQIAAEAAVACGSANHTVQSTRPIGSETIGDEFLFRLYEVEVSCGG